ncbi:MAG: c-type cytochrome, partial [Tepidisphaeraceae bacterium]
MITRRLLLCSVLSLAGCDRLPGRPTGADVEVRPDEVRDFATLYQHNCAGCHGQDGKGNGAMALANPVYLAIAGDDTIRRATAQGVPGSLMPPFAKSAGGTLTDDQIEIIVRAIRENWSGPDGLRGVSPPTYLASAPGDAGRGAATFATFCASCHGADGTGTGEMG